MLVKKQGEGVGHRHPMSDFMWDVPCSCSQALVVGSTFVLMGVLKPRQWTEFRFTRLVGCLVSSFPTAIGIQLFIVCWQTENIPSFPSNPAMMATSFGCKKVPTGRRVFVQGGCLVGEMVQGGIWLVSRCCACVMLQKRSRFLIAQCWSEILEFRWNTYIHKRSIRVTFLMYLFFVLLLK